MTCTYEAISAFILSLPCFVQLICLRKRGDKNIQEIGEGHIFETETFVRRCKAANLGYLHLTGPEEIHMERSEAMIGTGQAHFVFAAYVMAHAIKQSGKAQSMKAFASHVVWYMQSCWAPHTRTVTKEFVESLPS